MQYFVLFDHMEKVNIFGAVTMNLKYYYCCCVVIINYYRGNTKDTLKVKLSSQKVDIIEVIQKIH